MQGVETSVAGIVGIILLLDEIDYDVAQLRVFQNYHGGG